MEPAAFQSHCIPSLTLLLFTASLLVGMRMKFKFPSFFLHQIIVKFWDISVVAWQHNAEYKLYFQVAVTDTCIYCLKIYLAPLLFSAVTQQWWGGGRSGWDCCCLKAKCSLPCIVCSSYSLLYRMKVVCCEQVEQMLHEFNSF